MFTVSALSCQQPVQIQRNKKDSAGSGSYFNWQLDTRGPTLSQKPSFLEEKKKGTFGKKPFISCSKNLRSPFLRSQWCGKWFTWIVATPDQVGSVRLSDAGLQSASQGSTLDDTDAVYRPFICWMDLLSRSYTANCSASVHHSQAVVTKVWEGISAVER
jgi:hypothetical protein